MSNYAAEKELEQATGAVVDTSNLSAKKEFIALKIEVHKLKFNYFKQFKNKKRWLRCWKTKNCSCILKKLSGVIDKHVVKNTKPNALKVNKLRKKHSWCHYFNSHISIQHR